MKLRDRSLNSELKEGENKNGNIRKSRITWQGIIQ